ncbi:MAG: thiamine phosphate synthase [Rickettsiales bacterium]|nr:thiamine phosphate synthase [Rickettsiales bacterium]
MTKIYLISPPEITNLDNFLKDLEDIFSLNTIPVFQLRLKDLPFVEIKKISRAVQKICNKHNVLFIINDYVDLAIEIGAGGVHVGIDDENIIEIKKKAPQGFVVGASCYDSKDLAIRVAESGADYISFGAFFESQTKKSRGNPNPEIIKWANDFLNIPITVIGGINDKNCSILVEMKADFLCVISYIFSSDDKVSKVKQLNNTIKNLLALRGQDP